MHSIKRALGEAVAAGREPCCSGIAMRWRTRAAWCSLGCGLAGVVLAIVTSVDAPTHSPKPAHAVPSLQSYAAEPVVEPEPIWPTPQRPSSMSPPPPEEDEDELLRPTDDPIPVREAFWDPDSVVMPSPMRTRPAVQRWDPDTATLPDAEIVMRRVVVWNPDSAVAPALDR